MILLAVVSRNVALLDQPEQLALELDGIDTSSIPVELGRRKMVGGQEDMIVNVAPNMVGGHCQSKRSRWRKGHNQLGAGHAQTPPVPLFQLLP